MRCKAATGVLLGLLGAIACARPLTAAPETPSQRRHRLESMTAVEKEELNHKKDRFESLLPSDQQRLRKLHEQIVSDPEADKLQKVMVRYYDWLKSLRDEDRKALKDLPVDQRVPKIKELMKQQQEERFTRLVTAQLPPEDLKQIFAWLEGFIQRHAEALLAKFPPDSQRWINAERDPVKRIGRLRMTLGRYGGGGQLVASLTDEDEFKNLMESLQSAEALKALESVREPEKKQLLVQEWIKAAVYARMVPPVSNEELQRFYAEDLDWAKREQLEMLPREELQKELRRLYHWQRFRKSNEGGRPPLGPPGGAGPFLPGPPERPKEPRGPQDRRGASPRGPGGENRPSTPPDRG